MTEDFTEQRFIYAGKRMTTTKKLCFCWLPETDDPSDDHLRLFPKARGGTIGGIYTIKVNQESYLPNSVTFTGDRVDGEVAVLLEAQDRADGVRHANITLERNAARQSELKELCAPLRALVHKQVGWANRAALIAYITSEVSR